VSVHPIVVEMVGKYTDLTESYKSLNEALAHAGIAHGAVVEIGGVEVGRVRDITLKNYRAVVAMSIDPGVKLQDDAIVSVRTKGLWSALPKRVTWAHLKSW